MQDDEQIGAEVHSLEVDPRAWQLAPTDPETAARQAAAHAAADYYVSQSKSPYTVRAYKADWSGFVALARRRVGAHC